MTDNKFVDFYKLTGIDPNTDPADMYETVKKARRKFGRELHPDLQRAKGVSEEEAKKAERRLQQINVALDVLENPNLRDEYNERWHAWREGRAHLQEGTHATPNSRSNGQNFGEIIDDFFGIRDNRIWGSSWGGNQNRSETPNGFIMTDTDLALLATLREAYKSKENGKWHVQKAEDDKRDWMPDTIYTVKREGNEVIVYRIMTDWRDTSNREKEIKYNVLGKRWEEDKERISKPYARIHEGHLLQGTASLLQEGAKIPDGFSEYLAAMKDLAEKMATRNTTDEINQDIQAINTFNKGEPEGVKLEGTGLYEENHDREVARFIPLKELKTNLERVKSRISREGASRFPEGQQSSMSGENRV